MLYFRSALGRREEELLQLCWDELHEGFRPVQESEEAVEQLSSLLLDFDMLKGYEALTLFDAWAIHSGRASASLFFFKIEGTVEHGGRTGVHKSHVVELRMASFVRLAADFGRVLLRPETLADKIVELFRSREVDFPQHEDFSRRYYVLATDEAKLETSVSWEMLDLINSQDGIVIEINGRRLVASLWGQPTPDSVVQLAEFSCRLSEIRGATGR